jgi:hypothetical protein
MGSIDVEIEKPSELVNLSIDLKEDYERCLTVLKLIDKPSFNDITLSDVMLNLQDIEKVDVNKSIKLPNGKQILLKEYLQMFENKEYIIRKNIKL